MQDLKLYSSAAENSCLSGQDVVSFGEWSQHYVGLFTAHVYKSTVLIQITGTAHPMTQRHIPNYPHETFLFSFFLFSSSFLFFFQDKVCACMCKLEMWGIQITQRQCTAWIQFWFMVLPLTTDLFTLFQILWKSKTLPSIMVQNKPNPMLTKTKKPNITQLLMQFISFLNHRNKPMLSYALWFMLALCWALLTAWLMSLCLTFYPSSTQSTKYHTQTESLKLQWTIFLILLSTGYLFITHDKTFTATGSQTN